MRPIQVRKKEHKLDVLCINTFYRVFTLLFSGPSLSYGMVLVSFFVFFFLLILSTLPLTPSPFFILYDTFMNAAFRYALNG